MILSVFESNRNSDRDAACSQWRIFVNTGLAAPLASALFALTQTYHYDAKVTLDLKRLLLAVAIVPLILTVLVLPVAGQRKDEATTLPFNGLPYAVGERLTYNVSFSSFVTAGHIEIFVAARGNFFGRDAVQLKGHVETTGVVSTAIYTLNSDYTSYVDPVTGIPFRSQQVSRGGGGGSNAGAAGGSGVSDLPGAYDFLSAIYRLRALPLTEGSSYPFTVRNEASSYQAQLIVKGHQSIKTNVGSYSTIAAQVRVAKSSAANDYHLQVFFSDDERHVPVLITAQLSDGEVRAELAGAQSAPVSAAGPTSADPVPTPSPTPTPRPTPSPRPSPGKNSGPVPQILPAALPFKIGEQLNYRVYLASVQQPVGLVSFQIRNRSRYFDHDGLMLTSSAQTTDAAKLLFVVNDQLTSYVDPVTLLPYRTELNLAEGRRKSGEVWTLNQDYGTASRQGGGKVEIPIGTHDYLSIFYAVRSMNMAPPRKSAVSILVEGKPKTLVIDAVRREKIQLDNQKISAIQLKLTSDEPQGDKFVLRVWISDDDRRLPLRLTAMTQLGALRADLVIIPLTHQ